MGSDTACHAVRLRPGLFQSTLPGWGATKPIQGDRQNRKDFNPRSPDGERHVQGGVHVPVVQFQSTLPGWGATAVWTATGTRCPNFNPRSPDGERLGFRVRLPVVRVISIHAPRMGSDTR